jgi:hypothetical protein
MGSTYFGEVLAPGAGGEFLISIPEPGDKYEYVSGSLKVGSMPGQVFTGFTGRYEGGSSFTAIGENTVGEGIDMMYVVATIAGTIDADRQHVSGTISAIVNGAAQGDWTFTAAVRGAKPLPSARTATTGTGRIVPLEEPIQEEGYWTKFSTPLLGAAGVVATALGGWYLLKRRK